MRAIGSSGRLGWPLGLDLPLDEDEADIVMALLPLHGGVRGGGGVLWVMSWLSQTAYLGMAGLQSRGTKGILARST